VEEEDDKPKCPPPGAPGWLATFADLMSLLMSFFVLLLAFSEMDVLKFKQLAGSMSEAFGVQREIKTKEIPKGTSIIAKEFTPGKPMPTPLKVMRQNTTNDRKNNLDFSEGKPSTDVAQAERDAIKRLEQLKHALDDQIKKGEIEVTGNDERTIIRIREKGSFASGSATLSPAFFPVMKKIAAAVQNTPGKIHISGHTDNIPISTYKFRSNWELSSARAVSILEHMLRYQNIEESRIVIQGYADTIPLVPNTTASNRAMNRRVEIKVVKSPQPKKDPPSLIKFSE
jgi:chemotaxis protein MotB